MLPSLRKDSGIEIIFPSLELFAAYYMMTNELRCTQYVGLCALCHQLCDFADAAARYTVYTCIISCVIYKSKLFTYKNR